ncbi:cilia- and flagella-associated protein 157-like [Bolinopsis microptera]|uniref:cilia- and flagella-associated protein 157-like n=1 Tax=Bolinopsis microptera TaxID=2820187 RepID=UPI003078D217
MPPKKKGKKSGKGKKGGKKGKKSGTEENGPKKETITELQKEFYIIQINDLEKRLDRYQSKCDQLEIESKDLQKNYEKQTQDKKEIVAFLKKKLEQMGDEVADLQEKLISLQQAKDAEKDSYELQITQLKTEAQETKDQLTSENMLINGKLEQLEDFRQNKEELEAKFKTMEELLEQEQNSRKDAVYNLERKEVQNRDRLKKEMTARVNTVAAEFRKVSNKQMAETTKRTIRENVSINAQLAKMSEKTIELIKENDELRLRDKRHQQTINMLEDNEKELARKNNTCQKMINMLLQKVKKYEQNVDEYKIMETDHKEMAMTMNILESQLADVEIDLEDKKMGKMEYEQAYQKKIEELKASKSRVNQLSRIIFEAAFGIQVALQVSPDDISDKMKKEAIEQGEDPVDRERLFHTLLTLLAAAGLPTEGLPKDIITEHSVSKTSQAGKLSATIPSQLIDPNKISHYRLGDLGLVPKPASSGKQKLPPIK